MTSSNQFGKKMLKATIKQMKKRNVYYKIRLRRRYFLLPDKYVFFSFTRSLARLNDDFNGNVFDAKAWIIWFYFHGFPFKFPTKATAAKNEERKKTHTRNYCRLEKRNQKHQSNWPNRQSNGLVCMHTHPFNCMLYGENALHVQCPCVSALYNHNGTTFNAQSINHFWIFQ